MEPGTSLHEITRVEWNSTLLNDFNSNAHLQLNQQAENRHQQLTNVVNQIIDSKEVENSKIRKKIGVMENHEWISVRVFVSSSDEFNCSMFSSFIILFAIKAHIVCFLLDLLLHFDVVLQGSGGVSKSV